MNNFNLW